MGMRKHRSGRLLVAALLVWAVSITAPAVQAAPVTPSRPEPASPSLPAGPWPPAEVLASDPATTAAPEVTAQAAAACPAVGYGVNRFAPGSDKTVALTFDDGPAPAPRRSCRS